MFSEEGRVPVLEADFLERCCVEEALVDLEDLLEGVEGDQVVVGDFSVMVGQEDEFAVAGGKLEYQVPLAVLAMRQLASRRNQVVQLVADQALSLLRAVSEVHAVGVAADEKAGRYQAQLAVVELAP